MGTRQDLQVNSAVDLSQVSGNVFPDLKSSAQSRRGETSSPVPPPKSLGGQIGFPCVALQCGVWNLYWYGQIGFPCVELYSVESGISIDMVK